MNEKKYMDTVASLGCIVCGSPAQLHHIRQFAGMAQRASNWLVVPLCKYHHDATHQNTMHEGEYLRDTIKAVVNQLERK